MIQLYSAGTSSFKCETRLNLKNVSRTKLEQLIALKVAEALNLKSENKELIESTRRHDEIINSLEEKLKSIEKSYNNLMFITKRLQKYPKSNPAKITRDVRLQVCRSPEKSSTTQAKARKQKKKQ